MSSPPPMSEPPRSKLFTVGISLLILALSLLFIGVSQGRRLNFDESLALRAGWLHWNGIEGRPALLMPFTLLMGWLGTVLEDPLTVFRSARALVIVALLAPLALAFRLHGSSPKARFVLLVGIGWTLLSPAFVDHGFEFRYDAALVSAWLGAMALLTTRAPVHPALLGVLIAWISVHHLKGIFFGGGLYALTLAHGLWRAPTRGPFLRWLHVGIGATLVGWFLVLQATGLGADWVETLRTFAGLATDSDVRELGWRPWQRAFEMAPGWWLITAVGVARALWNLRHTGRAGMLSAQATLVWLAFIPALFTFVHPHAFAYMLVPVIPPLAALAAHGFATLPSVRGRQGALIATLMALLISWPWSNGPLFPYTRALKADWSDQVAAIRILKEEAKPGEAVIDPSGLAWSMPPCIPEWYIDTLFAPLAKEGRWMTGLTGVNVEQCRWLVSTVRSRFLPETSQQFLRTYYLPYRGAVRRAEWGDEASLARRNRIRWAKQPSTTQLDNYW